MYVYVYVYVYTHTHTHDKKSPVFRQRRAKKLRPPFPVNAFYRIKFEGGKGEGKRENSINKRGISMNLAGISGARCREEVICDHLLC